MSIGKRAAVGLAAVVVLVLVMAVQWHWQGAPQRGESLHVTGQEMQGAASIWQRQVARPSGQPLETDLQARYASAKWLLPMIDGLKQRSLAGDAEASYLLSRIYNECTGYFDPQMLDLSAMPAEQRAAKYRSTAWMGQRCEGIDGNEAALAWVRYRRVAADQGAFAAQVEDVFEGTRAYGEPKLSPADQKRVIELALSAQDPYAYLALSRALGYSGDGSMAALSPYPAGTQSDSAAWMLAACDRGLPCGADSPLLHQLCATGSMCGAGSVAEALGLSMSPDELDQARARAAWLLRNSGRRPPPP